MASIGLVAKELVIAAPFSPSDTADQTIGRIDDLPTATEVPVDDPDVFADQLVLIM